PTGAQERHDFQPVNVDFNLSDFRKTSDQLRDILHAYAEQAGMSAEEANRMFRGEGFERLVLASGGVPRAFLALLLEVLSRKLEGSEAIGKDDVRGLSLDVWKDRIEELKADAQQEEQDALLRGIYAIKTFCFEKRHNVFLIADRDLQERDSVRALINR